LCPPLFVILILTVLIVLLYGFSLPPLLYSRRVKDTIGVIRIRKSKKNRQHNDQK
jgi:hypothetical protein